MEKRKAATNIFMEQQAMPLEDELDIDSEIVTEEPLLQAKQSLSKKSGAKKKRPESKIHFSNIKTSEELQLDKEPVQVRITGFGIWKRVIVPPNAYVIHTRMNKKKPMTIGLGLSFRYNPNKDAYLIVPAAMQTIGVVANCISKEKQGINILAYVQWQINDFAIAYKKLDFSDYRDPLGIVNAQLREQAEAAIKDKIATMGVEEVLTDKAPIIKELTTRLIGVTEGKHGPEGESRGLGIKITTVQIREAIVSSNSLWTDLQSPFRNEQNRKAQISHLEMQNRIKEKEFESREFIESRKAESELEIEKLQQRKMTEASNIKLLEDESRFAKEQQNKQNRLKLKEQTELSEQNSKDRILAQENEIKLKRELQNLNQKLKLEEAQLNSKLKQLEQQQILDNKEIESGIAMHKAEMELTKLKFQANIERQKAEHSLKLKFEEEKQALMAKVEQQKVNIERMRQEIQNLKNNQDLFSQLISELPNIAAELPDVNELKVIQTGDSDYIMNSLGGFISKLMAVGETLGIKMPKSIKNSDNSDKHIIPEKEIIKSQEVTDKEAENQNNNIEETDGKQK